MNEKLMELLKDEDFCVKYFDNLDDLSELRRLLEENGIETDDEELRALVEVTKEQIAREESDELSEEELDQVAGGFPGLIILATAIIVAYTIYKLKTSGYIGKKK